MKRTIPCGSYRTNYTLCIMKYTLDIIWYLSILMISLLIISWYKSDLTFHFRIEINELLIAFREEIGGGAQGIVEAVAKFGNILSPDIHRCQIVLFHLVVDLEVFNFQTSVLKYWKTLSKWLDWCRISIYD